MVKMTNEKRVSVPRELIGSAVERGTDAGEGALVLQFRSVRLARGDASLLGGPALFSGLQGHFVSEKKSNPIGLLDFWVVWVNREGGCFYLFALKISKFAQKNESLPSS
jgi:hypothetical protein